MIALADAYYVPPRLVEIELTESVLAEDAQEVTDAIDRLRANGFAVLIDDFGSGCSSLNLLKGIPADTLKLDLKFLDFTKGNTSKGVVIIHSVIEMAHTLGIPVVVEGVETRRQADALLGLGCSYAQGYLFHKPLARTAFEELLQSAEIIAEGERVDKEVRLLNRVSVNNLSCRPGLHFVREYDGGFEFLVSAAV